MRIGIHLYLHFSSVIINLNIIIMHKGENDHLAHVNIVENLFEIVGGARSEGDLDKKVSSFDVLKEKNLLIPRQQHP